MDMKRFSLLFIVCIACLSAIAQSTSKANGSCGMGVSWTFDGFSLVIENVNKKGFGVKMENYNVNKFLAPWIKEKLNVRQLVIKPGVTSIGSCAFANCKTLQEVIFQGHDLETIGWGAFMNCENLRIISLPECLKNIETIAFANCKSFSSIEIPEQCRVGEQAFMSCTNLQSVGVHATAILGNLAFATEIMENDKVVGHSMYAGEIRFLPEYINTRNCEEMGLSKESVEKVTTGRLKEEVNYDKIISDVDGAPFGFDTRTNTYALIIGNQNYRFVPNVPYAIHDARVFSDYCRKTLGIPSANIHTTEDATKQMILEEELEDWLAMIPDREDKQLIVYYAGHGVPDVKEKNKAYILPTDVRGTNPRRGIALDALYSRLGELAFNNTIVFIDACFSGLNRDNEGVTEGTRAVEVVAEEATLDNGSLIVLSAAQGNETAMAFPEKGHGLFTYYLLKELQDTYGNVSFGDLSDRVIERVSHQAQLMKVSKTQTPSINTTQQIANRWRNMRF